ncbi:Hypothetical protein ORPV_893 [Orpheovirus IHUMI-LCC2]|uniref:Uncharacterized protein n=1 Tax=Orpheovirus IHUMI-LCC2 TaxID=2023057 RepID=A0A2I2L5J4_9VIRU|nr:Hypothetical protein ORPV_893 [Orpheovirus IHUMI-LCC2]SNW62797.1 Hypothetical protein ORPV_893 [Orpheovirus IHUMI-LCC2]
MNKMIIICNYHSKYRIINMIAYDSFLHVIKFIDIKSFMCFCLTNKDNYNFRNDIHILNNWKQKFKDYIPHSEFSYDTMKTIFSIYTTPPTLYKSYNFYPYSGMGLSIREDKSHNNPSVEVGSIGSFSCERDPDDSNNFIVVKKYNPGDDYMDVIYPTFFENLGTDVSILDTRNTYDKVYVYERGNMSYLISNNKDELFHEHNTIHKDISHNDLLKSFYDKVLLLDDMKLKLYKEMKHEDNCSYSGLLYIKNEEIYEHSVNKYWELDEVGCGCKTMEDLLYEGMRNPPKNNLYKIYRINMKTSYTWVWMNITNEISSKQNNIFRGFEQYQGHSYMQLNNKWY